MDYIFHLRLPDGYVTQRDSYHEKVISQMYDSLGGVFQEVRREAFDEQGVLQFMFEARQIEKIEEKLHELVEKYPVLDVGGATFGIRIVGKDRVQFASNKCYWNKAWHPEMATSLEANLRNLGALTEEAQRRVARYRERGDLFNAQTGTEQVIEALDDGRYIEIQGEPIVSKLIELMAENSIMNLRNAFATYLAFGVVQWLRINPTDFRTRGRNNYRRRIQGWVEGFTNDVVRKNRLGLIPDAVTFGPKLEVADLKRMLGSYDVIVINNGDHERLMNQLRSKFPQRIVERILSKAKEKKPDEDFSGGFFDIDV